MNNVENLILKDPRFEKGIQLFNSQDWYAAHDQFEELWHETGGLERVTIQAILQISVAQLHLSRGNIKGAKILFGEGLGRLRRTEIPHLGLDLKDLCLTVDSLLNYLHQENSSSFDCFPVLKKISSQSLPE